jgi:hypothetical protein
MFTPFPGVAKAVLNWSSERGGWSNCLWFGQDEFGTPEQLELANWFGSALEFHSCMGHISADAGLDSVDVYDMRSAMGPIVHSTFGRVSGTSAGHDTMPRSVCLVITEYTGGRGRSRRGRVYLTGFDDSWMTDGLYDQDCIDDWLDFFNGMLAASPGGFSPVIASRMQEGIILPEGLRYFISQYAGRSRIPGHRRVRDERP